MSQIPEEIKGALVGFVILLSKGLMEDDRWDWDVERFDWQEYQAGFCDPTILRTTLAVYLNNVTIDDSGKITNYIDARFRGFQYFRALIDRSYSLDDVVPQFSAHELEEPDWLIWED